MSREKQPSSGTPLPPSPESWPNDTVLLPPDSVLEGTGMMIPKTGRNALVKDLPIRRQRDLIRQAQSAKAALAKGLGAEETLEVMAEIAPELAKIATEGRTERVRIQASKELRELIGFLEGASSRSGQPSGSTHMSFDGANVIFVNPDQAGKAIIDMKPPKTGG